MSLHTPTRLKNVRRVSEPHRLALARLVGSSPSIRTLGKRLGVGQETIEAALTIGATFRFGTAERIERAIDEATETGAR